MVTCSLTRAKLSFGTSSAFSELFKIVNSKTAGQVGRKLEPLKMQVRSGIVTYERWKVPVGEFTISTEGVVNLVNRTLDVVTYVPIGAVSDKAHGRYQACREPQQVSSGHRGSMTEVPFRTTGSLDTAKQGLIRS